MGLQPIQKYSSKQKGLFFAIIMFVISLAYNGIKLGGVDVKLLVASAIGAAVGGLVYGTINWLRFKN